MEARFHTLNAKGGLLEQPGLTVPHNLTSFLFWGWGERNRVLLYSLGWPKFPVLREPLLLSPGREASMGEASHSLGSSLCGSQGPDRALEIGRQWKRVRLRSENSRLRDWTLARKLKPVEADRVCPGESRAMEMEGGPYCHLIGK